MIFHLIHGNARSNAARACADAPHGYIVTIKPPKKSRSQEALYHALISQIANKFKYLNKTWYPEDMKRLLVSAFYHDTKDDEAYKEHWASVGVITLVPGLRSEVVTLGAQTRAFPKELAAGFIDWLNCFIAEHGI